MFLSLSSRGDYGLLIMTMLAECAVNTYVSVAEISKAKKVPGAYASKLVGSLKKARLIESKEGATGGYRLARPASDISLKEIVEALEGPIAPVKCLREKDHRCEQEAVCSMKPIWEETTSLITKQLENKTLADITNLGSKA